MKNIIINSKNKFIANTLIDFIKDYFKANIVLLQTISSKDLNQDTLVIIIDNNDLNLPIIKELINKNHEAIVLTSFRNKDSIEQITSNFLILPIFLPHLVNKINLNKINKNNKLYKFEFSFEFDYNKAILSSNKLKTVLIFTSTEGNIFQKLFIACPNDVSINELCKLSSSSCCDINTLETHISNIKKKLIHSYFNISITKNKYQYKLVIN